jgi:hypothetical protein
MVGSGALLRCLGVAGCRAHQLEARAGADANERDKQKLDQRAFQPLRGRRGEGRGVSHRIAR